jgi:hypothetical protein
MKGKRMYLYLLAALVLVAAAVTFILLGDREEDVVEISEEVHPTETFTSIFPAESLTIEESGGATLFVETGALSVDAEVTFEDIGEGEPFAAGSPFSPASDEFFVDLGDADQIGSILVSVPLNDGAKDAAPADTSTYAYVAWAEPEGSYPSVVGVKVVGDMATFPVVGKGKYQIFKLIAHPGLLELTTIYDPLAVPTYPQMTPGWCSPTAMTDLVDFHQGAWPVGGFGAVWGESSNWYLAGKAGQPFDKGYFFHWLLGAGGYSVPADVKQSFSTGDVEVIIWNWKAAVWTELSFEELGFVKHVDYDYAEYLFDAFQAYVEYYVWGAAMPRRPVAWGSSLAGHSRIITGSDGTVLFYNDPGSGSLNSTRSWADYHQAIMDSLTAEKIEVIDTVVLFAEPQPANQRRGVLWLLPSSGGFPGAVALIAGDTGQPATNWVWGGDMGHEKGYYYTDLRGVLPSDPIFDVQFQALDYYDEVEFGFEVFNISTGTYNYHVDVILQNENLSVLENVGQYEVAAYPGTRVDIVPAGSVRLFDLPPGLYTLKFVLLQDGLYQDVKYVQFRVAETDLIDLNPYGVLTQNAFCRKGPDPVFDDVTAFEAGTELTLLGVNPERTWGKFETTMHEITVQCWIALSVMELYGGEDAPILAVPAFPEIPAEPVCVSTLDRAACGDAGGTYSPDDGGFCRCPAE